jgi:predicted kinase
MLTLTVGSPAAGKSTWAAEQGVPVVSCDGVRQELLDSTGLYSDQSMVLREARRRAVGLMRSGSHTIIDATNIDTAERLRNVSLAPPDIPVRYVVMDRLLKKKQPDPDWRKQNPDLVASHHEQFQVEVTNILEGDGRTNLSVIDMRATTKTVTEAVSA